MALYDLGKAHFRLNSNGTFEYLGKIIKREFFSGFNKDLTSFKYSFSKNDVTTTNVIFVDYLRGTFKEFEPKIIYTQEEKIAYEKEKQDNAFKLDPHEFGRVALEELRKQINLPKLDNKPFPYYHFSLDDDALDAIQYALPPNLDYQRHIIGIRTKPQPPKNRIPDRVVFDEIKGKVTVLISKHLDGVAPYFAYTSKVNVEGGDKYDAQFGFLLSYYKYLTRMYTPQKQKELIERIFNLLPTKRYPYLLGAVETEVMKLSDVVKSYKDWEELYVAITEPTLKKNGTWDYLEWKEMLRVHELETKREKQREVQKEIKKHQKAIEELKKKEV